VETVPPQPDRRAVWVDGQWSWDLIQWGWLPGGWVIPPRGGHFAQFSLRRDRNGRLEFAPASWVDTAGRVLPAPAVLKGAFGETRNAPLPPKSP
jgi:hypothetical protein